MNIIWIVEGLELTVGYTLAWPGWFEHVARAAKRLRLVVRKPGGCPINHR